MVTFQVYTRWAALLGSEALTSKAMLFSLPCRIIFTLYLTLLTKKVNDLVLSTKIQILKPFSELQGKVFCFEVLAAELCITQA